MSITIISSRVADPYLEWAPVVHRDGCTSTGWQVRAFTRHVRDAEIRDYREAEVGLRAICADCGACHELIAETGVGGPYIASSASEWIPVPGHATQPVKIPGRSGYWLHARGTRGREGHYESYYVTASATAPSTYEEIRGAVDWRRTRSDTWKCTAALVQVCEVSDRMKRLDASQVAPKDFATPTAAAKWIAAQVAP